MKQKELPVGYSVEDKGYYRKLTRESDGAVIAGISDFRSEKIFQSEDFLMSIYESDDWKALEVFYGNYLRELRARKQRGKM